LLSQIILVPRYTAAAEVAPPLVCEGNTPLAAWCKMVVESNSRDSLPGAGAGAAGEEDAAGGSGGGGGGGGEKKRVVASAGSADRFCLDDVDVVKALEADRFVNDMCPAYQVGLYKLYPVDR
jgi:hypothetical protein